MKIKGGGYITEVRDWEEIDIQKWMIPFQCAACPNGTMVTSWPACKALVSS